MRNRNIDYLRGICIFSVIILHFNIRFSLRNTFMPVAIYNFFLGRIANNGYMGVAIFFVISGFLITMNLQKKFGVPANISLASFYVFRIGRIFPGLITLLAILCGLHLAKYSYFVIDQTKGTLKDVMLELAGLRFNVYRYKMKFIMPPWDVLWSLTIEEVFYLTYPILCRALGSWGNVRNALLLVLVVCPLHRAAADDLERLYDDFSCFDLMAIGCLTALATDKISLFGLFPMVRKGLKIAGILVIASIFFVDYRGIFPVFGVMMVGLGVAAYLLGNSNDSSKSIQDVMQNKKDFFALRILRSFGVTSYEIYISHCIVVNAFYAYYALYGFDAWFWVPFLFIGYLVAMGYLGNWIYCFYTEPLNRAIRRLGR